MFTLWNPAEEPPVSEADVGPEWRRLGAAPCPVPLVPWRYIRRKLLRAFGAWPNRVLVIIDRSEHLTPLVADHHRILHHLRRILGEDAVPLVEVGPNQIMQAASHSRKWAQELPAADVVLIMGDVGATLTDPHRSMARMWEMMALGLRASGRRTVLLTPIQPGFAFEGAAIGWVGRLTAPSSPEERWERAQVLGRMVAAVSTSSPAGLVRDLRALIPGPTSVLDEIALGLRPGSRWGINGLALSPEALHAWRLQGPPEGVPILEACAMAANWDQVGPPELERADALMRHHVHGAPPSPDAEGWALRLAATLTTGQGAAGVSAWARWLRRYVDGIPAAQLWPSFRWAHGLLALRNRGSDSIEEPANLPRWSVYIEQDEVVVQPSEVLGQVDPAVTFSAWNGVPDVRVGGVPVRVQPGARIPKIAGRIDICGGTVGVSIFD